MAMTAVQKLARSLCQSGAAEGSPNWPCEDHCRQAEKLALEILMGQSQDPPESLEAVPGVSSG